MKRNGILVIVDMQNEFSAARDKRLVGSILRKIRLAKMLQNAIILVEYGRALEYEEWTGGDTHYAITNALTGYKRTATVVKNIDDGSSQIIEAIDHYRFPSRNIYICGVNTCACVYATVRGMARRMPYSSVYVLSDSCGCSCDTCSIRAKIVTLRTVYPNVCLAPLERGSTDELHRPGQSFSIRERSVR